MMSIEIFYKYQLKRFLFKKSLYVATEQLSHKKIPEKNASLRELPITLTEYDHPPSSGCDALVRRLIEKVTIYEYIHSRVQVRRDGGCE